MVAKKSLYGNYNADGHFGDQWKMWGVLISIWNQVPQKCHAFLKKCPESSFQGCIMNWVPQNVLNIDA